MPYRPIDPAVRDAALARLATGQESQRAIARDLGIHHTTIARWSNGGGTGPHRADADRQRRAIDPWADPDLRPTWAYLFGMYLGDGYVDPLGRLRIFCDKKYPGIIDEIDLGLRRVGVTRPWHVLGAGCTQIICGDHGWGEHLPTGRGPKHTYPLVLTEWHDHAIADQPHLVLRGLLQSDGCRYINRVAGSAVTYRYPSYSFSNMSGDIHRVFGDCCALLGVLPRFATRGRTQQVTRRADVAVLDLVLGAKR